VLADVLTPVFLDMERNAPAGNERAIPRLADGRILSIRKSRTSGDLEPRAAAFHFVRAEKAVALPLEQFRMPDELWVKIVYDFALAHRLHNISRDHPLKSIRPLYLGGSLRMPAICFPQAQLRRSGG